MTAAKDEETLHRTKPGQRPVEESVGDAKGEEGGLIFFCKKARPTENLCKLTFSEDTDNEIYQLI